jgi:hypothetical protein
MRHVLLPDGADMGRVVDWYLDRLELAERYPSLRATQMASLADLHRALVATMAARLGRPESDLLPSMVVASAMATFHLVLQRWQGGDRAGDVREEFEDAFRILREGFGSLAPVAG